MRSDGQVLLKIVIEGDTVVGVLEKLDVLLQVLQIQLLLRLEEQRPVRLVSL